ncbi:hypothetical protein AVEN_43984-1 [Araneus ventricosus]|uniref:Uncharacterized protein n=1 Tax=Araneus ventricosus TaxID=182803 RepID=A0A4Y2UJI4_ARAVE|nr:hypothetical protein AVEN_43984-1 [Araneus ventricosus]
MQIQHEKKNVQEPSCLKSTHSNSRYSLNYINLRIWWNEEKGHNQTPEPYPQKRQDISSCSPSVIRTGSRLKSPPGLKNAINKTIQNQFQKGAHSCLYCLSNDVKGLADVDDQIFEEKALTRSLGTFVFHATDRSTIFHPTLRMSSDLPKRTARIMAAQRIPSSPANNPGR